MWGDSGPRDVRVNVRLFAGTRDAVGAPRIDVDLPEAATVGHLLDELVRAHPRLAAYRGHVMLAVDGAPVTESHALRDGAVAAIMPPVSGGALDPGPLDLPALRRALRTEGAGAVVEFLGLARPPADMLRFDAYEEMATEELARVREEAVAKFSLIDCALRHRTGDVPVGEPAVAVLVSARHRREAFAAAAWVMDELKARVHLWKQEIGPEGTRWVNDPLEGDR